MGRSARRILRNGAIIPVPERYGMFLIQSPLSAVMGNGHPGRNILERIAHDPRPGNIRHRVLVISREQRFHLHLFRDMQRMGQRSRKGIRMTLNRDPLVMIGPFYDFRRIRIII